MQKKNQRNFFIAISILVTFVLWTISLCFVDVQPVGPQGSSVGFAMLNCFVHNRIGVHMALYQLTDWLDWYRWDSDWGLLCWERCNGANEGNCGMWISASSHWADSISF